MEPWSAVPFGLAVALSVAACAGAEQSTPEPPAGAGSTIARDYLGDGPPPQPAPDRAGQPHEFNSAERWIAEHLPWVPPWAGR
jgi:hypothetical protein